MGKSAGLTYRTIFLEEHGKLCNEDIQCILDKGICFRETGIMEKPVYLGIGPDMKASYFIGADWLDEKEGLSVVVHPKKEMENVDYFKMFMACLENSYLSGMFRRSSGNRLHISIGLSCLIGFEGSTLF